MATGVVFDECMLLHGPMEGYEHPEKPSRLASIWNHVVDVGLVDRCERIASREATEEELLVVHSPAHVKTILGMRADPEQAAKVEKEYLPNDSYATEHTTKAAVTAVGSLLNLVQKVVDGEVTNGFAFIRPPGHHSGVSSSRGFCLFNNVAIAAAMATREWNVGKILILDWDIHHGNGTQEIFEKDPSVLIITMQRYLDAPKYFYPGTGGHKETGEGEGKGFSVNIPWTKIGMGDGDFMAVFSHIVMPIAREFGPDLVLISAGFDGARGDPLGKMTVTPVGYAHMTYNLCSLAHGKVVGVLEGGYAEEPSSKSAAAVLRVLLGDRPPSLDPELSIPSKIVRETIVHVLREQGRFWKSLLGFNPEFEAEQERLKEEERLREQEKMKVARARFAGRRKKGKKKKDKLMIRIKSKQEEEQTLAEQVESLDINKE